jgi:chlorobactene glucosyltransferase
MVFFLAKSRRNYEALPQLDGVPSENAGLTVIIPARNEELQIRRCLSSFEPGTIVVDDASTDRTSEIARSEGAVVIAAPCLAPGVMGKPNACMAGARQARTKWLLFVDADTWYSPDFAAKAVAYAERERLDVLTAFLRQQRETWAERVILPYAFALYFCGVTARNVNAAESGEALANGQCLLVRREAYEQVGGHDAVKASVIEDVAFAMLAKQRGLRLRVVRAERLGSVRMYSGFSSIWRGLEKNSFRFLKVNPLTGAQVIAASIALTSWLPAILLAPGWLAVPIALAPSVMLKRWYGNWLHALTAPLAIYAFQLIALSGMVKSIIGGTTLWKGRRV